MKRDIYMELIQRYYQENGTLSNMPTDHTVEFEGKKYNIYRFLCFIRHTHKKYAAGEIDSQTASKLLLRRYDQLEQMGFKWVVSSSMSGEETINEPAIRYLRQYYAEHGTINTITTREVVEFEGKPLNIGSFFNNIRAMHKQYLEGGSESDCRSSISLMKYKLLDEMEYDWEDSRVRKRENVLEGKELRYLRQKYEQTGTINDIKARDVVEFEGKPLKIGVFIAKMRNIHNGHLAGRTDRVEFNNELTLARFRALDEMEFAWKGIHKPNSGDTVPNEPAIRYLRQYYTAHGTIDDIPVNAIVEFEDKLLYIGGYLSNIRNFHKQYIAGSSNPECKTPIKLMRYKILDEMNYDWEYKRVRKLENVTEEIELRYLKKKYLETGTINDISFNTEVEFEGQILKIGVFLAKMRSFHNQYISGRDDKTEFGSNLTLARYKALEELEIEWAPISKKIQNVLENDIYMRYLKKKYDETGTINDIPVDEIVEFDGQVLKIGKFLKAVRWKHRQYLIGDSRGCSDLFIARYQALEDMNFTWSLIPDRVIGTLNHDPYIEYLKYHYEKYGTLADITFDDEVEFTGVKLNIGSFISKMRSSYSSYISGELESFNVTPLMLKRYKILTEMGLDLNVKFHCSPTGVYKTATEHGIPRSTLKKYYDIFEGDLEKALKIVLLNKKKREEQEQKRQENIDSVEQTTKLVLLKKKTRQETSKKTFYTLETILAEFNIDLDKLLACINRDSLKTGPRGETLMYEPKMSLKRFCIKNGYNYKVIERAVKLRMNGLCDEDFESLINRAIIEYRVKGQQKPATWIYSKYGNEVLVKHMLLSMGFDSTDILKDMSRNAIGLEEAFSNAAFKINCPPGFKYLEGIYRDMISFYKDIDNNPDYDELSSEEAIVTHAQRLMDEYYLSSEEFEIITESFKSYTAAIHKYHLYEVGFEKDEAKRIEKIISYKLNEDEVEEAFFLPLQFDQKVLLGRDSILYKRRALIREITISWNDFTEDEKLAQVESCNLTTEELHYINTTRQTIDTTKAKVYTKNN